MLYSMVMTLIYLILALLVFFFILGNISLMQLEKDNKIKTQHKVGQLSDKKPVDTHEVIDELKKYGQQLVSKSAPECKSAKQQIMRKFLFKKKQDEHKANNLIPGLAKEMASVDDDRPTAPILENFEDYAPIDTPVNPPKDKGQIHVKQSGKGNEPKAMNELETQHLSKFESEYRAPWNSKRGKDDLSYFFDTHKFDKSYDQSSKRLVICPSEWEKQIGKI